jgi:uncharacterized protein (DUF1015 family)
MDTTPAAGSRFALEPFRALRLADSYVGDPIANRVFARPYRSVPGRLRDWRRKRHLRVDRSPAIYLHEYTSAGVSIRGIVALLDLPRGRGRVFPHEDVDGDQVRQLADRMADMSLNPAPILLMHRGPAAVRETLRDTASAAPDLVYTDRADQLQRIWRITDPAVQAALAEMLAGSRAVIADGHHRYAAATRLQAQRPGTGWDRTLVMLIDQADTPLQLCAIHRSIPRLTLTAVERVSAARGDDFRRHDTSHQALAELEDAIVLHDGQHWATLRPTGASPPLVTAVHETLLPAWEVREDQLLFHHTAAEALASAGQGCCVLLPAPTFDQVASSARSGQLLPQKATSFQPKPHVGVLMRDLRDG